MAVFNNQKINGKWKNKILFLVLLVILIIVVINLTNGLQKGSKINHEVISLEQDIKNLEQENLEFKELIEYFNSSAYIEEKARVDLGLKKEGEKVLIIANTQKDESSKTTKNQTKADKPLTNPQKWWRYFFN